METQKNEINFCLSSKKQIITNFNILNNIRFSSDHRPLHVITTFKVKINRAQMICYNIYRLAKAPLLASKDIFNLELKNSFGTLNR